MEDKLYKELEELIKDLSEIPLSYLRRIHKMCYLTFGYNNDQDWNVWLSENNDSPLSFDLILSFRIKENMNYKEIGERILRFLRK